MNVRNTLLQRWSERSFQNFERIRTYSTIKIRTSNVRSPLELGSDRHETSGKHVSDDLQLSIFRRRKNFFEIFFEKISGFSRFSADFRLNFELLTSPAASTSNFASDTPFLRSVRPKIDVFGLRSSKISNKLLFDIRYPSSNLL